MRPSFLAVLAIAAAVAGCTTADLRITELPIKTVDPALDHPTTVEQTEAVLSLSGDRADLSPIEKRRLDDFILGFLYNGGGRLVVEAPAAAEQGPALARARAIVARARARGVRADEIALELGGSPDDTVTVSYQTAVAIAPVCGDWSQESSHDLTNGNAPNFGCAVLRNTALMISNPADLTRPRQAQPHDTIRSNLTIQRYRAAETTLTKRQAVESATLTDVSQ